MHKLRGMLLLAAFTVLPAGHAQPPQVSDLLITGMTGIKSAYTPNDPGWTALRQAANAGDGEACARVGVALRGPEGAPFSIQGAAAYKVESQVDLGHRFATAGSGVVLDKAVAYNWLRKAATNGASDLLPRELWATMTPAERRKAISMMGAF